MTRQELRNYISLTGEIAELRQELAELERTAPVVTDTVQGSTPEAPYTLHAVTVSGIDPKSAKAINEKRRRLRFLIDRCEAQREEIRTWIDQIPDSTVRRIFRLRYMRGLSWVQIASRFDPAKAPDAVRMLHNRYINNQNNF